MQFKNIAVAATAFAVGAQAAISSTQVQTNIDAITQQSTQANTVAQSISVVNVFQTTQDLVTSLRQLYDLIVKDAQAMQSKRKRQECLNVEDVQKCIEDLEEIIEDPSEILGDKRSVGGSIAARALASRAYDEAQQEAVCRAYHDYTTNLQQTLATIIGKHGVESLTPYTKPIAAVLRSLDNANDNFSFLVIDEVPKCAADATQNKDYLSTSFQDALDAYAS